MILKGACLRDLTKAMEKEDIKYLFSRYSNQLCTREEYDRLLSLITESENDEGLRAILDELWLEMDTGEKQVEKAAPQIEPTKTIRLWPRIAAAASVLLMLSAGGYFLLRQKPNLSNEFGKNDIAPFSKQAILKTGHGRTLILGSNGKGMLARFANTNIQKTGGEQISYTNNSETGEKIIFDTLQVPAGGKPFHLKLADGSSIIINVASALRFPENFRRNNNMVELISGEAYFSILHNAKAPLTIKARDQVIRDIGTAFDVNTYTDEPGSRTTLAEGRVTVNARTLIPGQQATITGNSLTIAGADIEQITAWIRGYFRFNGEDIQTVMRELARWYNIQVTYEGKISGEGYYTKISRSKNISEVLRVLERTNSVRFKIEGRRVTVLSKK